MTRDQAAEIITSAIVAAGPQDQILGADAFAARLATALDALGLLQYADTNRLGISATSQDEQLAQIIQATESWATTRSRA